MADKTLYARIKYLIQSANAWSTNNPTLLNGEVGFESDTRKFKVGDGSTKWNSLSYAKVPTVNNLTSDSTYDPLSAAQGKELKTSVDLKAPIASPTFTGVPNAPTATQGTNTNQIATTAFVKAEIDAVLDAADAMQFKGVLGTGSGQTSLPTTGYKAGWTYKVGEAGTYAGAVCEVGDLVICIKDYVSPGSNLDWTVIQGNMDGIVTGPASSVNNNIALFSGSSGKVIKDSGITITRTTSGSDIIYTLSFV